MKTTDTLTDDQAVEALLSPIETEDEAEAVEAPQNETDTEEAEIEADAPEAEDEEIGEDDEQSEGTASDDEASDDDEEDDTNDDEQSAQLHTVAVDGEQVQVTLEEALRGYSGQRKIQKGMEENATVRRALEQQAQTIAQQSQAVLQLYEQAQQTGFKPAPQMPDASLLDTDPFGYMQAKAKYDQDLIDYNVEQEKIAGLQKQYTEQQEAAVKQQRQAKLAAVEQQLAQDMPEIAKDPEKAKVFQQNLTSAAEAYGIGKEELPDIVTDYRAIKVLLDAQKWRALEANKKAGKKPVETPKSATRPKGKARDTGKVNFQKGLQKAIKSGRTEDFAALLLDPDT